MRLRHGGLSWEWEMDLAAGGSKPPVFAPPTHQKIAFRRPDVFPTVDIHGIEFHAITESECIGYVMSELAERRGGVIVTPNLDFVRRATRDVSFGALISEADLVVADGMPLIWASRLQGSPLPGRVAGSDLISSLSAAAAQHARSLFLLGGDPGTAEGAARVLIERHPTLSITGTLCPPKGFESNSAQMHGIKQALLAAKPDVVFVALGSPKQEMLIAQLRVLLPEAWWVGVGISFSFLTGSVVRAPSWMQNTGLEWIHRLAQEPGRLFKRYVYHGLPFAASLLASATTRRLMSKLQRSPVRGRVLAAIEAPPPDEAAAPINGIGHATETQPWPGRVEPVSPPATGSSATRHLHRLRALVLLGGSVRVNELVQHCQRSVLDLPLDENGTIFCHWLDHAAEVARLVGLKELPLRVLVDRLSPEPSSAAPKHYGTFSVERDVNEFRGTAGLLSDLADKYEDEDLILVANAAQILLDPLAGIASALDRLGADAGVISHTDGTPSGIMLFSGKTLRVIPRSGFVDMKEQSLPTIASQFDVRVVERRRPTGLPIRSLGDYVSALRLYHRRRRGLLARLDPLGEETKPSFTLVEEGAKVDPSALLHDAVVLKGGSVEAGAVVVRSVVCGAASVKRDARAVDQFVVRIPG